jgi:hypothetical protein
MLKTYLDSLLACNNLLCRKLLQVSETDPGSEELSCWLVSCFTI